MGPVEQLDRALDFEGLIELADETIEQSMREIDQRDLVIALKGASSAVREKFLCNMLERVQVFISEEVGLVRCEPGQMLDSQARIVMHMYNNGGTGQDSALGDNYNRSRWRYGDEESDEEGSSHQAGGSGAGQRQYRRA
jgi:hypothetical protein